MQFQNILVDNAAGVCQITLNRPERRNAIDSAALDELIQALTAAKADDEVRVVVMTGAGSAFCSGADLHEEREGGRQSVQGEAFRQWLRGGFQHLIRMLYHLDKPTIAMVNGPATASGFDLAMTCDMRVGSDRARFMVAFTRIGMFPGTGGTWYLPRMLGLGKALELLYTGDFLEASQAKELGLLNHLVPHDELQRFTLDLATRIAVGPPIAQRLARVLTYRGLETDLDAALEFAAAAETITAGSGDRLEGRNAFLEKRVPRFSGQ